MPWLTCRGQHANAVVLAGIEGVLYCGMICGSFVLGGLLVGQFLGCPVVPIGWLGLGGGVLFGLVQLLG